MATVADLIKQSLRLLRVYGPNETPTTTEQTDGLAILNEMIDAMNADRAYVINVNRQTFSLTAAQGAYTIGPSGDFNTTRPLKVESAGIILDFSITNPIEVPLEILTNHDEWAAIYLKNLPSTYPRKLYYEPNFPLGTVNLWPVPSGSLVQLIMYLWQVIAGFAATSTTISVPPGWYTFLRTNLAIWLAEEYGVTPTDNVVKQATESKERIKEITAVKIVPILTTAFPVSERGRFNIILGDWKQ